MDQFNYKSDFENFLKNSIEDFIMIPQRKVWYGIYNHMHPEKRWPSIAVCLLILISILHIGVTNNKTINKEQLLAQNKVKYANKESSNTNIANNKQTKKNINTTTNIKSVISYKTPNIGTTNIINQTIFEKFGSSSKIKSISPTTNKNINTELVVNNTKNNDEYSSIVDLNESNDVEANNNTIADSKGYDSKSEVVVKIENSMPVVEAENKSEIKTPLAQIKNEVATIQIPKKSKNTSISYYLTPSLGYRTFNEKKSENKSNLSNRNYSQAANSSPLNLKDDKSVNIEFGVVAQHKLNKKYQLKVGAQFNYTNYVSSVGYLKIPIQNTLALNSTPQFQAMDYESTPSNAKLNKTTLQISIPIGVDKKILGNDKIAWYVGATIQPTYVFGGNAYVLSSDTKNYSNQKDLLRRFNINAAAETFLSIKTANGIHLNIGPQIRRQLLNTFKSSYKYSEKLYNVGVKVGVNTSF